MDMINQINEQSQVEILIKKQMEYILTIGGYLELKEADEINNDLNRDIIEAYAREHEQCFLGNINFYDQQRIDFIDKKISAYVEYTGQLVCNCSCDFVVPIMDCELDELIRSWNRDSTGFKIELIFQRIRELKGIHFVWS